jgi:hypothetical protein
MLLKKSAVIAGRFLREIENVCLAASDCLQRL